MYEVWGTEGHRGRNTLNRGQQGLGLPASYQALSSMLSEGCHPGELELEYQLHINRGRTSTKQDWEGEGLQGKCGTEGTPLAGPTEE